MISKGKVAVSGTTGFVGGFVKNYFEDKGYEVVPLTRAEFSRSDDYLASHLAGVNFIIHLAGESVVKSWNARNRQKIVSSRVDTTLKLARAIELMPHKPQKVINASAIGIYSYHGKHTEESTEFGTTFLTYTVKKWEEAAGNIAATGVPLCICRIGVVMGKEGGMLPRLVDMLKRGVGVRIGSGKQVISFIHVHDLARAFLFLLNKPSSSGIYNMVAPEHTSQERMLKILHRIYKKSILVTVPAFVFKWFMGERANMLVEGENVIPQRLEEEGYEFLYPNIENVLFYLSQW